MTSFDYLARELYLILIAEIGYDEGVMKLCGEPCEGFAQKLQNKRKLLEALDTVIFMKED